MAHDNRLSTPMMPPPLPAMPHSAMIQCTFCGCPQFFGEKRISSTGKTLVWIGLAGSVLSLIMMFFMIGFCTIFIFAPMLIIGLCLRRYVNVCARCRRAF